jgi:hypothetical protein
MRGRLLLALALPLTGFAGCSSQPQSPDLGPSTFAVQITSVNGTPLPTAASPLPPNHGTTNDAWAFTIQAVTPTGQPVTDFDGYVRLTLVPGTVVAVTSTTNTASGSNILLQGGQATGVAQVTAVYGPARLWVEDLGYVPAPPGVTPQCSNGKDDNDNGLIDYPSDPGCYFADDNTEDGGSYAAGISPEVQYALPFISDVRGAYPGVIPACAASAACGTGQTCNAAGQCTCGTSADCPNGVCVSDVCVAPLIGGARTPYPNEGIAIAAADPEYLVITRVASDGFFVSDVSPAAVTLGYNSLFAYNFSTPGNMQVCDRITSLSGTVTDFYGFTQLGFPSFTSTYTVLGADGGAPDAGLPGCQVPEPTVLAPSFFAGGKTATAEALYRYEAGLVRLEGFSISPYLGPGLATNNNFTAGQSNCDFNGDGVIDYTQINGINCDTVNGQPACEGDCANACDNNPQCSEWSAFITRSQFKMTYQGSAATMIQANTSTATGFDPRALALQEAATKPPTLIPIPYVTGSLTEFSGGNLNWTVEVRCADDLVCPAELGCTTQQPIPSTAACVSPRTSSDNNEGSN